LSTSAASFGCLVCFGTASHEPPQLPEPPGTAATSQLPLFSSPAAPEITPSIHDGQPMVAKSPPLMALFHGGLNACSLAVRPSWLNFCTQSKAVLTAGLDSRTSWLSLLK